MRKFKKISVAQFDRDFSSKGNYENVIIPERSTNFSAGYDFKAVFDFHLNPGEIIKIPTGIKCQLNEDDFLAIYIRSSIGFKYNIRLTNQVGIIDSDYYNNEQNEGHIWISFQNEGNEIWKIKQGEKIAQGIIQKYYTVDEEQGNNSLRTGGIGSTGN